MKFSLMTYTMHPVMNAGQMSLLEVLEFAQKLGFAGIEFSMPDFSRASQADIRCVLDELGLKVSCINGTYSLAAAGDAKFTQAVADAKAMIDTAVSYSCGRVMYVPALREDIAGMEDRSRAADRIAEALRQVITYAKGSRVIVTVEDFPHLLYPLSTIDEILRLLEAAPGLRLTLDNGNFLPGGDDLMVAYNQLRAYVENVHLKDWEPSPKPEGILCRDGKYIRGGSHGKGLMDQASLLRALKQDGYDQYLAFEYEGVLDHAQETRNGIAYLQSLVATL